MMPFYKDHRKNQIYGIRSQSSSYTLWGFGVRYSGVLVFLFLDLMWITWMCSIWKRH